MSVTHVIDAGRRMIKIGDQDRDASGLKPEDLVCYCFRITKRQIEEDFIRNGRSLVLDKIKEAKKEGGCDCARLNPRGR